MTQTHNLSVNKSAIFPVVFGGEGKYPFGMTMPGRKNTPESYRFGFNNQEKDDEITGVSGSHLNFKFRMYDSRIARFFAVDPLAPKYPYWTPYQFAGLMPIRFVELEGLEPGEPFASADAAAEDFGKLFNDNSIRDNREYGTKVYSYTDAAGATQFSYAIPVVGQPAGVSNAQMASLTIPSGATVVAYGHSHGAATHNAPIRYQDNVFSGTPGTPAVPATPTTPAIPAVPGTGGDMGFAEAYNINGYVTTPNGSLQKYDVTTKQISTLSTSMPTDTGPATGVGGTSAKSTSAYTVKSGDTLSSIAQRYKTTVSSIATENSLSDPNKIRTGQTINVTN